MVEAAVARLREAWATQLVSEAHGRFPALAERYEGRLRELPITRL